MSNYPTAWQRRALWTALTIFALVGVGVVVLWVIYEFGRAVGFLQPVLIPFAVAAILAFLLDPVVRFVVNRTRLSRHTAIVVVFAFVLLLLGLLLVSVVPRIYASTTKMIRELPEYTQKAQGRLLSIIDGAQRRIDQISRSLPGPKPKGLEVSGEPLDGSPPPGNDGDRGDHGTGSGNAATTTDRDGASPPSPPSPNHEGAGSNDENGGVSTNLRTWLQNQLPELQRRAPELANTVLHFLVSNIGGALGVFGTLLNVIIVPVYLYFLLAEGPDIGRRWKDYVPLRNSPLKTEVVSVLTEINGYLVAFFRGQLIVSTIDGILIGTSLAILGLDFAFFIGVLVVFLTFIPYLGIVLCYIPATLVAIIQYGDFLHPAIVVGIMFTVQTLEGYVIAPKIVGESTGLHPLTVIVSVFFWSLLLDGPLGAILAVPLTATLKVLARRYVWERQRHRARLVPTEDAPAVLAAGGTGAITPAGPLPTESTGER